MQSARPTVSYFVFLIVSLLVFTQAFSQENSPFSRYGLGDLYPQQNIASRGMGGITAVVSDAQFINSLNPASYGSLSLVTYDFGLTIDARTLRSANPLDKYSSANFAPSYIQLGLPVSKKGVGLVFGLRPLSKINYAIEEYSSIAYKELGYSDSLHTLYEGNGGSYQAFIGLGKRWLRKSFSVSVGFNGGYEWGNRYVSTRIDFPSDSSYQNWYKSNSADTVYYSGLFLNPGLMANFKISESTNPITKNTDRYYFGIGATGTLEQRLSAVRNETSQTFSYNDDGSLVAIDSVFKLSDIKGHVEVPLTYTAGFMVTKNIGNKVFEVNKWGIGADYTSTKWTQYRYFGEPDQLINSWYLHAGAYFSPQPLSGKNIFANGTYRLGFYTGKDYINADGNGYKVKAFTLGYSFNLRKFRSYDRQFTKINTALEVGERGTGINNVTENFFKFSLGLSLSDVWFIKRKYD